MKAKSYLLIGATLGAIIGWAFGFLRLPYLEKNLSFLLGFITCLAFIALGVMVLFVWNKRSLLRTLIGKNVMIPDIKQTTGTSPLLILRVLGVVMLMVLVGWLTLYRENASLTIQNQKQSKVIKEMSEMLESVKNNNGDFLVNKILRDVDDALKSNPRRILSDTIIARMTTLSSMSAPYRYLEGDSLSEKKLSPERGQLLLGLCLLQIDSGSFATIKQQVSFSYADLKGANLKGINLSKADLQGANLQDADLTGANLGEADLQEANFFGVKLNNANLSGSNLKRANLSWAELNGAKMQSANLNGAILANTQLRKADLRGATFQWVESEAALLDGANLTRADFTGAALSKTNLNGANMNETDLRRINLREATSVGATLNKAVVEENWFEKLNEWRLTGAKEIQENFKVVNDSTDKWKKPIYRLKKINDKAEVGE